jgi:hypothetical protein
MLLSRHPYWMTREGLGTASIFFVVQEGMLPASWHFWRSDRRVKERIFRDGQFPWDAIIDDLPNPRFFGELGGLDRRASSCRIVDNVTRTAEAVPIEVEEYPDHFIDDPRTGGKAVNIETRGAPRTIGDSVTVVPHEGHRIVKVAWCASVPMKLRLEERTRAHCEKHGEGAWFVTPIYDRPRDFVRYLLAFWDVPMTALHIGSGESLLVGI